MAEPASTREILAREERERPRGAIAALIGAATLLASAIASGILFGDAPRAWFGEALGNAQDSGRLATQPSVQNAFYTFYDERSGAVLAGSVVRAIGWLATGYALYVLARAVFARRAQLPRVAVSLPLVAGVLSAVSTLLVDIASKVAVSDFLSGPRTVAAAQDVTASAPLVLGQFIGLAGTLFGSLAFVLIGLNAMRAGLLTRFMGVLAIIVGVLLIFPLGSPIPVVQCFWLGALAALLLGRWPKGMPPAWTTGEARPWPSAAEARGEVPPPRRRERATPAPQPAAVAAGGGGSAPRPNQRKRKRKKRS